MIIMSNENKVNNNPKKSSFLSGKLIYRLVGAIFFVIGIISILNGGGLSSLLFYGLSYLFGVFSYVFIILEMALSIYLMIFGRFPKMRINFAYLGIIFIFFFGCLCSCINVENLSLENAGTLFQNNIDNISNYSRYVTHSLDIFKLSGGIVGYMFTGLFLSGLGYNLTLTFIIIFLVVGSILCLYKPILNFFGFIKGCIVKSKNKKKEKISKSQENEVDLNKEEVALEREENVPIFKNQEEDDRSSVQVEKEVSPFKQKEEQTYFNPFASFDVVDYSNKEKEVKQEEIRNNQPVNQTFDTSNEFKQEKEEINNYPSFESTQVYKQETQQEPIQIQTPSYNVKEDSYIQDKEEYKVENVDSYQESKIAQPSFEEKKLEPTHVVETPKVSIQQPSIPINNDINNVSLHKPMVFTHYPLPSISLLKQFDDYSKLETNQRAAESKIEVINGVFTKLDVKARVRDFTIGPSVTRFNIERANGVKVSAITNLDVLSELQVDLKGDTSVRIEGVVQGETTSGIEIANPKPMMVCFRDCYGALLGYKDKLSFPLGKNISNDIIIVSLDDMPHLLISGTTGSGKSVFVHSIIMSLIMRNYPDEVKFILVDPKQVEFSRYRDMPHLYCPIITNVTQAVAMLKKLCGEMERRYQLLSREECSKIQEYQQLRKEKKPELENLPSIVCIIDEFADMMGQDPKNVDSYTQRLAQKARAAGIYLIIATQRPSVKNITGTIKANIPARVALMLPTNTDSRTILDEGGAETLIGKGDLLAKIPSLKAVVRLQSAYVSNEEISNVVHYLKDQCKPDFDPNFISFTVNNDVSLGHLDSDMLGRSAGFDDELYPMVKDYVIKNRVASTSALSRYFRVGYSRAASLLDALEQEGIVKTTRPGGPKEVIVGNFIEEDENTI